VSFEPTDEEVERMHREAELEAMDRVKETLTYTV